MSDTQANVPAENAEKLTPEQVAEAKKAEAEAKKEEPKANTKKKIFVCETYPDLMIKGSGVVVRFNNGKFSTDDTDAIDLIEKSASYKVGQIVIDDAKKKENKEE